MRRFFQRLEHWEKRLQLLLVILFSLLVILQVVMAREPFRFYLSFAERMEGIPWPQGSSMVTKFAGQAVGEVKIELCNYIIHTKAAVYINDKKAASFEDREVLLTVRPGDEIIVDGTAYPYPLTFQVSAVSENVSWPPLNQQVTTKGSQVSLGKVKIDR
ncbi:MAG: hypothetical protein WBJ83_01195 [Thermacetogeniaceae bacterium]|jgi:hypothetical protein|nr:hypothetical protein [Syntrophomonadaceae bacterium]